MHSWSLLESPPPVAINYLYDAASRLVKVTLCGHYDENAPDGTVAACIGDPITKAEYGYDPFGRRLWSATPSLQGDEVTYYLYADEGLIGEYKADGTPIRTYGYFPGSPTPLFQKVENTYYWYRNDRLGTPQKLVNTDGLVVWSSIYDSFGNCQVLVDTVENNLRFPGQYYDKETGLYYNLNRYYNPKIGRYLQTDPAGDGLNPYVYAAANPVNFVDPLGLCSVKQILFSDWTDEVTLLGTAGQIALGVFGLDLPWDISDIVANVYHRRWGSAALSAVAIIPVVGALKYGDEVADVWKSFRKISESKSLARLSRISRRRSRLIKSQIIEILENGNTFSARLAREIRNGNVRLHFRRLSEGTDALYNPINRVIYVQSRAAFKGAKGVYRAAVDVVHEGQHYFDHIAGVIKWSNDPLLEARAFLREAQFAKDIGRSSYSVFGRIRLREGSAAASQYLKDLYGF